MDSSLTSMKFKHKSKLSSYSVDESTRKAVLTLFCWLIPCCHQSGDERARSRRSWKRLETRVRLARHRRFKITQKSSASLLWYVQMAKDHNLWNISTTGTKQSIAQVDRSPLQNTDFGIAPRTSLQNSQRKRRRKDRSHIQLKRF